ncbi:MAG: hypothetical protein ABIR91_01490 [Candidatus Saccharimonadales bacterium]
MKNIANADSQALINSIEQIARHFERFYRHLDEAIRRSNSNFQLISWHEATSLPAEFRTAKPELKAVVVVRACATFEPPATEGRSYGVLFANDGLFYTWDDSSAIQTVVTLTDSTMLSRLSAGQLCVLHNRVDKLFGHFNRWTLMSTDRRLNRWLTLHPWYWLKHY